jgi:hypothetical protein
VNQKDLHRPLRAGDDLEDAFAWKEERTLSQALTQQYDKVMFILEPSEPAKAAIGKRVTVVDYPDGRLSIRYQGIELVTARLTRSARSIRAPSLTTSGWARCWRSSEMNSCAARPNAAVGRGGAIRAMPVCSRSAELICEPCEPALARSVKQPVRSSAGASGAGRALRYAGAPRPPRW